MKLQENPDKIQVVYINSRTERLMNEWFNLKANEDFLDEECMEELEELNRMFADKVHIYSETKLSESEEFAFKREKAESNKLQNDVLYEDRLLA